MALESGIFAGFMKALEQYGLSHEYGSTSSPSNAETGSSERQLGTHLHFDSSSNDSNPLVIMSEPFEDETIGIR